MGLGCDVLRCFGTVQKICVPVVGGKVKIVGGLPPKDPSQECCKCEFNLIALAETGGQTADHKNDKSSVVLSLPFPSSTVTFELQKFTTSWSTVHTITDATYGSFYGVGFNPNDNRMTGTTLEWFGVLRDFGEGFYRIKINVDGTDLYTNNYCLREYHIERANDTVRFDWELKGVWGGSNGNKLFDFGTTNIIEDSIRVIGYFGRESTEYEREEIEYQNGQIDRVRDEGINKYEFTSGLLPADVHDKLKCFSFLSDCLTVTDYNTNNDKVYTEIPIIMDSGYDPSYNVNRKESRVKVEFKDKIQNKTRRIC